MSDDDLLIVSMGDSVASGEGNPDVPGNGVPKSERWLQRRCHRSLLSGHAEAALAAERADRTTDVGFVPIGCSGATIDKGLLHRYRGIEPRLLGRREPPQVDRVNALAEQREIDALLVSIGANDVHFSDIVKFCVRVPECWTKRFNPANPFFEAGPRDRREPDGRRRTLAEVVARELRAMPGRYAELEARLSDDIPADRVVIVEYFDPTHASSGRPGPPPERFCHMNFGALGDVTAQEFRWAYRKVLTPLNAAIHAAADEHRWRVVGGVSQSFADHGICAKPSGQRWIRSLAESLRFQGMNVSGTLHPNGAGHVATSLLIEPVLREILERNEPSPQSTRL